MANRIYQCLRKGKEIFVLIFFVFFVSCRFSEKKIQTTAQNAATSSAVQKPILTQELFSKGKEIYKKQCSVCHGPTGAGDGKAAYLLYPKPRDFIRDKFRLVSTTNMQATDGDLFATMTRGMPGSSMPPWGHLGPEDRWALVYYIRYLSDLKTHEDSAEVTEEMKVKGIPWEAKEKIINKKISEENIIKIPSEPPVTPEALKRGQELFVASCAGCHGLEGKGDGQQEQKDNLGYPVKPRDLTAGIFKGSSSSGDLYCRMMGGMPGSPMPSYAGALTTEQVWDIIHYVQTLAKEGAEQKSHLTHLKIKASKTKGEISLDPLAEGWLKINPAFVTLTPLWWRNDRVEEVEVKARYNKNSVAFHLTWSDPTKEDDMVAVQSFSDGAALQFSAEEDPPFFGMGNEDDPVYIWNWKAGWQDLNDDRKDIETRYPNAASDWYAAQKNYEHGTPFETSQSKTRFHDPKFITGWGAGNPVSDPERKTAAEEATAEGQGSYTVHIPKVEQVDAKGIWQDGKWHVVFVRSLKSSDKKGFQFKVARPMSIALALWDGAHKDRNGQKMVSLWNTLILEK